MKLHGLTLGALIAASLTFSASAQTETVNVLISVDKTGAQVPIDSSDSRVWNFEIKSGINLNISRALFGLNDGGSTTAPITFTLYSGLGGTGTVLAQVSLDPSQVDNSFSTLEQFSFTNVPIVTSGYYSATLTSTTPSGGSKEYMLKSGALALYVDDGSSNPPLSTATQLSSNYWVQDTNTSGSATTTNFTPNTSQATGTAVPEPSSLVLAGIAAGSLVLHRTLRRRRES